MQSVDAQAIIQEAISIVAEMSPHSTDGQWLEDLTAAIGPHLKEWDVARCHPWAEWPERERRFPDTTNQDVGIDAVAVRRSDGENIAIQCKARKLDARGNGDAISKEETDKFASASAGEFWAERWIVTNGNNPLSNNAQQVLSMTNKPIKMVNIASDLLQQQATFIHEACPHCEPNPSAEGGRQTKTCMQTEAIEQSVRILKEHEQSVSGGLPVGQARGKIILPCGTGKTRISLRIIEELTPLGKLSIVLCPSIALVAQIRREYLQNAGTSVRALAVCSDETAGYDPKREDAGSAQDDPTLDRSNVSASEVKGKVTTDPAEIATWIRQGQGDHQVNIIFGTYQSSHRIGEALRDTGTTAAVLVADEAHRTAGLRRNRKLEERIRDFTICHDNNRFPAKYRVYQTATPRVYDTAGNSRPRNPDWVVRNMDDEAVFGVELYRKSYMEAVANGWLADYRIIALGVNDPDAFAAANALANTTAQKGRNSLTTTHFLKGMTLALVLGGGTARPDAANAAVKSCISFMNTVAKSKAMAQQLQSDTVREWVQKWLENNRNGQRIANYTLEHLDATSNVTARENAKSRLAQADEQNPHGIVNVGIFGEGTDSPSLSAVAFLEARKSPIDVIQAVGRAMRTAPDKEIGYIICPIMIPPNVDAERWLMTSGPEDGWQELGQILLALRAHDSRIEDNLSELLQLYVPAEPETEATVIAIANREDGRIHYHEHVGPPGDAQRAVESVLEGNDRASHVFVPLTVREPAAIYQAASETTDPANEPAPHQGKLAAEPATIIAGKKNNDGNIEMRVDSVVRTNPQQDGTPGSLDIKKTKAKAKAMINQGNGVRLTPSSKRKPRRTQQEVTEHSAMQMLLLTGLDDHANAITANLLTKSGLSRNRVVRDLNILEASVNEASRHLRDDELSGALDAHFQLDNLKQESRRKQADGCTVAALLLMNAAMLHQRIAAGRWLSGISDLEAVKNDVKVVRRLTREWERIMRHDFQPVLAPAVETIQAAEDTGKTAGLERALRHITAEAERIAETYADMGADHAGPLFNRVMGNQASDGAYFTRPVAASIAARLTLDACGDVDWTDPETWKRHKTVDLACGSGTLLAAMLADMKRRARDQGAGEAKIADLQKLAVEETVKGLDINPVSLQLAAAQLTTGNREIRYRKMGLHLMPYGPRADNPTQVSAGTLEILAQKAVVPRDNELGLADDKIRSQVVWDQPDDATLEDAVEAANDARIVIMNPPFTNRSNVGQKFPDGTQKSLRTRIDSMERTLVRSDRDMDDFVDKNSIAPLFVALADRCLEQQDDILTVVHPTVALTNPSGQHERVVLARRYHIHTVLTCHQPGQTNLSQKTNISESIMVMCRCQGAKASTRFINLDRLPADTGETDEMFEALAQCQNEVIPGAWGQVSYWPAERMAAGDWTPAIWRSPELAQAAYAYASRKDMQSIEPEDIYQAGRRVSEFCKEAGENDEDGFALLHSKGADGQTKIKAVPDRRYKPQDPSSQKCLQGVNNLKARAGHLLITDGQRNATARLTAVASDTRYVGVGWMPVTGWSPEESKAIAVFLNATVGRIQIMSNASRTLEFPMYRPAAYANVRIPNIRDDRIRQILADCWERTKDIDVPQFRDGECNVRRLWDEAVANAMGWDPGELTRLRQLLHQEPHVRGLGYNQYADEPAIESVAREHFQQLADQWESETVLLSSTDEATEHPAYQSILIMGEPAIPLILERMGSQGGHWFHALHEISQADPVKETDRGDVETMQASWKEWGERNGYV